jgi:hypothetical protein
MNAAMSSTESRKSFGNSFTHEKNIISKDSTQHCRVGKFDYGNFVGWQQKLLPLKLPQSFLLFLGSPLFISSSAGFLDARLLLSSNERWGRGSNTQKIFFIFSLNSISLCWLFAVERRKRTFDLTNPRRVDRGELRYPRQKEQIESKSQSEWRKLICAANKFKSHWRLCVSRLPTRILYSLSTNTKVEVYYAMNSHFKD